MEIHVKNWLFEAWDFKYKTKEQMLLLSSKKQPQGIQMIQQGGIIMESTKDVMMKELLL